MSQSKKGSLIEALITVATGFGISMLIRHFVYPLFGLNATIEVNFYITCIFTITSITRCYIVRRVSERLKGWKIGNCNRG